MVGATSLLAVLAPAAAAQSSPTPTLAAQSSVGSLSSQVANAQAQVIAESAKVRRVALQVSSARAREADLATQVAGERSQLAAARRAFATDEARLRSQAVSAFIDAGPSGQLSVFLASTGGKLAIRQEYMTVATGNLSATLSSVRHAADHIKARELALQAALAGQRASVAALGRAKRSLGSQVASDEALLTAVQARLQAARQAAARQAAARLAAARQAAAQQAAAQSAALLAANQRAAAQRAAAQQAAAQQAAAQQAAAQQAAAQQAAAQQAAAQQATLAAAPVASPSPGAAPDQGMPLPGGAAATAAASSQVSSWGSVPAPPSAAAFAALRQCESSGNYATNTGNGYYGAYQFSISTWQGLGYSGLPSQAAPSVQDQAASRLQASSGWQSWPACSAMLGLD
ncbi:MAG: transglycosylase family protein [Acidimicrobiales bacterium]